jgi:hypothetical protein
MPQRLCSVLLVLLVPVLPLAALAQSESTFIMDLTNVERAALNRRGEKALLFQSPTKECDNPACWADDTDFKGGEISNLLRDANAKSSKIERLAFCFSPSSTCLVEHYSKPSDAITGIYYTSGLPQFYTTDIEAFVDRIDRLHSSPTYGEDFVFVPTTMLRDGAGEEKIETEVIEDNAEYVRKFALVAAPPTFGSGRALCKFPKFPWGTGNPYDCIFTRYWKDGLEYRLGIKWIRYELPFSSNMVSAYLSHSSAILGGGFAVEAKDGAEKLFDLTIKEMISGLFKADPNRIEKTKGDGRLLVLGSVGPRLSVADNLLREQVDFSLIFEMLGSTSTTQAVTRPRLGLSAWVNRQNTDKPSDWRMPAASYVSALQEIVSKHVSVAFASYCRSRQKVVKTGANFEAASCD